MKYAPAWEELKEEICDAVERGQGISLYALLDLIEELENKYE